MTIFAVIVGLILVDWCIVQYTRNKMQNKVAKNEYGVVFYNNTKKIPINSHEIFDFSKLPDLLKGKKVYINNVGDPNSYNLIKHIPDYHGNICKNDLGALQKYNSLRSILPLVNFIPNRIAIEIIPDIFCLNLGVNFPDIFLYGIYANIMKSEENNANSVNLSFVNVDAYNTSKASKESEDEIMKQFELLFNAYPYIKEHMHFYIISSL